MLPQVSDTDVNAIMIDETVVTQVMGADFDGDEGQLLALDHASDPARYVAMRAGLNLLSGIAPGASVRTPSFQVNISGLLRVHWNGSAISPVLQRQLRGLGHSLKNSMASFPGIGPIVDAFIEAVSRGDIEAGKEAFYEALTSNPDAFVELAQSPNLRLRGWQNVIHGFETEVNRVLWLVQQTLATRLESSTKTQLYASPAKQSAELKTYHAREAATWGETLRQMARSTDLFRIVQGLYYVASRRDAMGDDFTNELNSPYTDAEFREHSERYVRLTSGVFQSATADAMGASEPSLVAQSILKGLLREFTAQHPDQSLSERQLEFALATLSVGEGKSAVTLAQLATSIAARIVENRAGRLLEQESHAPLRSKLEWLRKLTPGGAIFEIFGAMNYATLVGSAGLSFGGGETLAQSWRQHLLLGPVAQKVHLSELRSDPAYQNYDGSTPPHTLAFSREDLQAGRVPHPYAILIEALAEHSQTFLSMQNPGTGKVVGTYKDADNRTVQALVDALARARKLLRAANQREFTVVNEKLGEISAAELSQALLTNRALGEEILALIPHELALHGFGSLSDLGLPVWFIRMLSVDPEYGAKIFLRETLIQELDTSNRTARSSQDSFVNFWQELEAQERTGTLNALWAALIEDGTIEDFLTKVNLMTGGGYFPILAFHRDMKEFDSELWNGGWSMNAPLMKTRQRITAFATRTDALQKAAQERAVRDKEDDDFLARAAIDPATWDKLVAHVQERFTFVVESTPTLTGTDLHNTIVALISGPTAHSTEKAMDQDALQGLGMLTARGPNITSQEALEQGFDTQHAFAVNDIAQNPAALLTKDLLIENPDGTFFVHQRLTPERWLEMYRDHPSRRDALRTMLGNQFEVQQRGSTFSLTPVSRYANLSIEQVLLDRSYEVQAMSLDSNRNIREFVANVDQLSNGLKVMRWDADGNLKETSGRMELSKVVARIATMKVQMARANFDGEVDVDAIVTETMQVVSQLALIAAEYGPEAFLVQLREALPRIMPMSKAAQQPGESDMAYARRRAEAIQDEQDELLPETIVAGSSGDLEMMQAVNARLQGVLGEATPTGNFRESLETALRMYAYPVQEPETSAASLAAQDRLRAAIDARSGAYRRLAGEYDVVAVFLTNPANPPFPASTAQANWRELSLIVAGVEHSFAVDGALARTGAAPLPNEVGTLALGELLSPAWLAQNDTLLAHDPTFFAWLAPFFAEDSPVITAVTRFKELAPTGRAFIPTKDKVAGLLARLYDNDGGRYDWRWSPQMPAAVDQVLTDLQTPGIGQGVTKPGNIFKLDRALTANFRRTFRDPADPNGYEAGVAPATPRTYRLSSEYVQALQTGTTLPTDYHDQLVSVKGAHSAESHHFLNGRAVTKFTVTYEDARGVRHTRDLVGPVAAGQPTSNVTAQYQGSDSTSGRAYGFTSEALVRRALEDLGAVTIVTADISVWHPADKPATPEYANNIFFEGLTLEGNADYFPSLIGGRNYSVKGRVPGMETMLKSKKQGLPGYTPPILDFLYDGMPLQFTDAAELSQLSWLLKERVLAILDSDLGSGDIKGVFYNAIYKQETLSWLLRGRVEVEPGRWEAVVYSVEEALELVARGQFPAATELELIPLSTRGVRTMLGEQSELAWPAPFTSITEPGGYSAMWTGRWSDEQLARLPRKVALQGSGEFAVGTEDHLYSLLSRTSARPPTGVKSFREQKDLAILRDALARREERVRASRLDGNVEAWIKQDQEVMNFLLTVAGDLVITDAGATALFAAPENEVATRFRAAVMKRLTAIRQGEHTTQTSWVVLLNGARKGNFVGLSQVPDYAIKTAATFEDHSDSDKKTLSTNLQPGDNAVIVVDTLSADPAKRETELRELVQSARDKGVYLSFVALSEDLFQRTAEAASIAQQYRYERVEGSRFLLQPEATPRHSVSRAAALSRLHEAREIRADNRLGVLFVPLAPGESIALANPNATGYNRREIGAPVPLRQFRYSPITDRATRLRVAEMLRTWARDPQALAALEASGAVADREAKPAAAAARDAAAVTLRADLSRLLLKAASDMETSTDGLPTVRLSTGDIVVEAAVNRTGGDPELLLTRWGHLPFESGPHLSEAMAAATEAGLPRVAINGTIPDPAATTHSNVHNPEYQARGQDTFVQGFIPQSELGARFLQEEGLLKGSATPIDPDHPLQFASDAIIPGMHAALMMNQDSLKGYDVDIVRSHREAIAAIGYDPMPFYIEHIFGISIEVQASLRADAGGAKRLRQLEFQVIDYFSEVRRNAAGDYDDVAVVRLQEQLFADEQITDELFAGLSPVLSGLPSIRELRQVSRDLQRQQRDILNPASALITRNALAYLHWEKATVDTVLAVNGLGRDEMTAPGVSYYLPEMLTGGFDTLLSTSHPAHQALIEMYDARLGPEYSLQADFQLVVRPASGSAPYNAEFGFLTMRSSEATSERSDNVQRRNTLQNTSVAESSVLEAVGLQTFGQRFDTTAAARRLTPPSWSRDQGMPEVRGTVAPRPYIRGPVDRLYVERSIEASEQFKQPIDRDRLTDDERTTLNQRMKHILGLVRGPGGRPVFSERDVDMWVRIWTNSPRVKGADPESAQAGPVAYSEWIKALSTIAHRLENGLPPTYGSLLPGMTPSQVLGVIRAVLAGKYRVRTRYDDPDSRDGTTAESVVNWAWNMVNQVLPVTAFQTPLDGFRHSFVLLGAAFQDLVPSADGLRTLRLMDERTGALALSTNRDRMEEIAQARETAEALGATPAHLEELFGGIYDQELQVWRGNYPPGGLYTGDPEQIEKMKAWESEKRPFQAPQSQVAMSKDGRVMTDPVGSKMPSWVQTILSIMYTQVAANPLLWIAGTADTAARLGTTSLSDWFYESLNRAEQFVRGEVDREQIRQQITDHRSAVNGVRQQDSRAHIMRSLAILPEYKGNNKAVKALRMVGLKSGMAQDLIDKYSARLTMDAYVKTVRHALAAQPELAPGVTDAQLLRTMKERGSMGIEAIAPRLHSLGVQAVVGTRGMRRATVGVLIDRGIRRIDQSSSFFSMLFGLAVQPTIMFRNFAFSTLRDYGGFRTLDAALGLLAQAGSDRAQASKLRRRRTQAEQNGGAQQYSQDEIDDEFFQTAVAQVDFVKLMMQDFITHSVLVSGMMALSQTGIATGDDEEDEYRRERARERRGRAAYYDPREIENDWLNRDAMYLDFLPNWLAEIIAPENDAGRHMATPAWWMKLFLSPMLGLSKAEATGDLRHIFWGYEDAFLSSPILNFGMWAETVDTAAMMMNIGMADVEDGRTAGDPGVMMDMFLYFERKLLENSFLNSLYVASDTYDRNPFRMVDMDAAGQLQRDKLGQTEDGQVYYSYVDEQGITRQAYVQFDGPEAQFRSAAEGRFTLAILGSLFGGLAGRPSMIRHTMPIQQVTIDRQPLAAEEAEALLLTQWDPNGKREVLAMPGAEAILQSLRLGVVKPGSPGLEGVTIPFEMRQAISEKWQLEIIQEGVDLGLSLDEATRRYNELWWGNGYNQPLSDVVWSMGAFDDAIPYSTSTVYNQLNTTFVRNPVNGMWLATGITRANLANAFGAFIPYTAGEGSRRDGTETDARLNTTDPMVGLNTGRRALERAGDWEAPTIEDIEGALLDLNDSLEDIGYLLRQGDNRGGGGGGYSRGGGGGGGGGYSYRLNAPGRNEPAYGRSTPYIRLDTPLVRRASIRRERFSSDRGRLNQWQ